MIEEITTNILLNYGVLGLWTLILLIERWKFYAMFRERIDEDIKLKTKLITLLEVRENKI